MLKIKNYFICHHFILSTPQIVKYQFSKNILLTFLLFRHKYKYSRKLFRLFKYSSPKKTKSFKIYIYLLKTIYF